MDTAAVKLIQIQKTMNIGQKLMLQSQYYNERKSPSVTSILAILGLHYFYLGETGLGFLYWMTCGGLGLWWFIDLYRAQKLADIHNQRKLDEITALILA